MKQSSKALMSLACGYLHGQLEGGHLTAEDLERFCGDWDIIPVGTEEPHTENDPDMEIYLQSIAVSVTRTFMQQDPGFSQERLFAIVSKLGEKAADGLLTPSTIAILCKEPPNFFARMYSVG